MPFKNIAILYLVWREILIVPSDSVQNIVYPSEVTDMEQ